MYNKIFTKILDSSVWLEPTPTRIVWFTFLAAMDEIGFVHFASAANVAHRARVELAEAEAALAALEAPDPHSSDPEHDGRRIERVPGGWLILNAVKYRDLISRSVIQEQTRQRVKKYRERLKSQNLNEKDRVTHKRNTRVSQSLPVTGVTSSDTEAEARADTDTTTKISNTNNKLVRKAGDSSKGNGHGDSRSKRPIFTGQRLVVFEWMFDDLRKMLGPYTDGFDLHEWFFELDRRAVTTSVVIPPRDGGAWLLAATFAEAQHRGYQIASSEAPTEKHLSKQTRRLLAAINNMTGES